MLELTSETGTNNHGVKKTSPGKCGPGDFLLFRLIGSINPSKKIIIDTPDLGDVAGTDL